MVFRGDTVMSVAHLSADIFQRWIPASERIRSGEMLQLVCCFPLQQLGRFKFNGIQFRINVIWQRWLATSFGPSPV
ncbi:unnamed protein product [Brassica oleracea]